MANEKPVTQKTLNLAVIPKGLYLDVSPSLAWDMLTEAETPFLALTEALNVHPNREGLLISHKMFDFFIVGATEAIDCITIHQVGGIQYVAFLKGSSLLVYNSTSTPNNTPIGTLPNTQNRFVVSVLDHLIIGEPTGQLRRWDGTTLTTYAAVETDKVKTAAYFENRLAIAGKETPAIDAQNVYLSDVKNVTTGFATTFIACYSKSGDDITALANIPLPGSQRRVLFVGKKFSCGVIDANASGYAYQELDSAQGVLNHNSVLALNNTVYFISHDGFYRVSGTNQTATGGFSKTEKISTPVDVIFKQVNITGQNALSYSDEDGGFIYLHLCVSGATKPNKTLIYSIQHNVFTEWAMSAGRPTCGVQTRGYFVHASGNGQVYKYVDGKGTALNTADVRVITATMTTQHQLRAIRHKPGYLSLSNTVLSVGAGVSYENTGSQILVNSLTESNVWGASTWGGTVWSDGEASFLNYLFAGMGAYVTYSLIANPYVPTVFTNWVLTFTYTKMVHLGYTAPQSLSMGD